MKNIEKLLSEFDIKNDVLSYTWRMKPTAHLCVSLNANGHCKLCNKVHTVKNSKMYLNIYNDKAVFSCEHTKEKPISWN